MHLGEIIRGTDQIIPELNANTRWEAIEELIALLARSGKIRDDQRAAVAEAIRKRETSMSTGIGNGIGIPHAPTEAVSEFVGALGRSAKGIDFEAIDRKPVHLVVLFAVPKDKASEHLNTLASIAKALNKRDLRKRLQSIHTAEEILQALRDSAK